MAQKLTLQSVVKLNSGYTMPLLGYGVSKLPDGSFRLC